MACTEQQRIGDGQCRLWWGTIRRMDQSRSRPRVARRRRLGYQRWSALSRQLLRLHLQRFLTECRRCLHGGGVLRVAMPSLHEIVHLYNENEWAQEPWIEKHGFTWMKTRAEYINICFREWGHQWLYDAEELRRRLLEAGFTRIEDAAWGESKHPELRSRETRKETLLICEAAK
jgi:predicted SAM-dependent methyltransferase